MCHQNYACESCLALQILCGIIFHIMRNKIFTHSKSVFAQHTEKGKKWVRPNIQILAQIMCCMRSKNSNGKFSIQYVL